MPPSEQDIFDACNSVKNSFEEVYVIQTLHPPSPLVQFSIQSAKGDWKQGGKGGRRVGTGKGTTISDTSPEEAAAWAYAYCSRERMRINFEKGNTPRVIIPGQSASSRVVVATVKPAPFPLWPREGVFFMQWMKSRDGSIVVCLASSDDVIDYGVTRSHFVRASTEVMWEFSKDRQGICTAVHYSKIDPGGWIPIWLVNKTMGKLLGVVNELRVSFQRDVEIDLENRLAMKQELNNDGTVNVGDDNRHYEHEEIMFDTVADAVRINSSALKETVEGGTDYFVKVSRLRPNRRLSVSHDHRATTIFSAEVFIDSTIDDCVAWAVLKSSRQRMQTFYDNDGGASRSERRIGKRRFGVEDTFLVKRNRGGLGELLAKCDVLWKKGTDGRSYVVVEHHKDSEAVRESESHVSAASALPSVGLVAPNQLSQRLSSDPEYMRQQGLLHSELQPDVGVRRSDAEIAHFNAGGKIALLFDRVPMEPLPIKSYPGLAYRWASKKGHSAGFLEILANVRGTPLDIIAKRFDVDSFKTMSVIEKCNAHCLILLLRVDLPSPFKRREYVNIVLWRKVEMNDVSLSRSRHPETVTAIFEFVAIPTTHPNVPETPDFVRGETYEVTFMFEHSMTNTEYISYVHADLRGDLLPNFIVNSSMVKHSSRRILDLINLFDSRRRNEWEEHAEADRVLLDASRERIQTDSGVYSANEQKSFDIGLEMEKKVASAKLTVVQTKHTLLNAKTVYVDENLFGQVTCLVPASIVDILAFYMEDVNTKFVTLYERGESTVELKVLEDVNSHHLVVMGRYTTPFSDRFFVGEVMWRKESDGSYFLVNTPTDHQTAPPPSSNAVRGESYRASRLQAVSQGITRLTITFTMDLKGSIPSWVTNSFVIPSNLVIPVLYQKFFLFQKPLRDFDEKGENASMLAQLLIDDVCAHTAASERKEVLQQYFVRAAFLRAISTEHAFFPELLFHILQNRPRLICIPCTETLAVITTLEASSAGRSFAACLNSSFTPQLAIDMWIATYPAMAEFIDKFAPLRSFLAGIAKCLAEDANLNSRGRLQRQGAGLRSHPKESKMLEMNFETAEKLEGVFPQTKVDMHFTLGAKHSTLSEEELALAATRHLSEMRLCFDKSLEIDSRGVAQFVDRASKKREVYSEVETDILEGGLTMFANFKKSRSKLLSTTSPSYIARGAVASYGEKGWGLSTGIVRARDIDIMAYIDDKVSRNNVAMNSEDDLERAVIERPNDHNQLLYVQKKTPAIIADRDFLGRVLWRAEVGEGYLQAVRPEENGKRPTPHGVVRGKYPSAVKITKIGVKESKFEFVVHPDIGGSVPSLIANHWLASTLSYVREVQDYFQAFRPLSEYDEKDGAAIGDVLMLPTIEERERKNKKHHASSRLSRIQIRVGSTVDKHVALKEFVAKNPWFPYLVEGMLSNWLADPKVIRTKYHNLSKQEALNIGKFFAVALFDRQIADVAVDMFVNEYVSLVELSKKERFFVPMALTIGQRKLEQAPWGLLLKVGTGAVLSVLDVATDIYAVTHFLSLKKYMYATAVGSIVGISIAIQVAFVVLQNRKRGVKQLAMAILIVLSGFKPAFDAFRVISGSKAHVDDLVLPMEELVAIKMLEVVIEAIPSALIQLYGFLESDERALTSFVSIVVSVCTITFGITCVCFDFDVDIDKRAVDPDMYGLVPNNASKRNVVFLSMFGFTSCNIAFRMLSLALLSVLSPMLTGIVVAGDILVLLLFKLVRNDLRSWFNVEGVLSWVASLYHRLICKVLVDFTGMVDLRAPLEMGEIIYFFPSAR